MARDLAIECSTVRRSAMAPSIREFFPRLVPICSSVECLAKAKAEFDNEIRDGDKCTQIHFDQAGLVMNAVPGLGSVWNSAMLSQLRVCLTTTTLCDGWAKEA